jgi:hypothetical protein
MNNFQVTIERVYTTTINVSAASEAEAIIAAQNKLEEQELEQMNVDIADIRVEQFNVERNEEGDELVVGCAKCGRDVYETNDHGHCRKCAR